MASGTVETSEYSEETEQEQPGAQRAPMVQRLLDAPNLPAFVQDLITTQATTVVGTEAIGFLIENGEEGTKQLRLLAHVRPDNSAPDVREAAIKAFIELVKPCVKEGKDGAIEIVRHPRRPTAAPRPVTGGDLTALARCSVHERRSRVDGVSVSGQRVVVGSTLRSLRSRAWRPVGLGTMGGALAVAGMSRRLERASKMRRPVGRAVGRPGNPVIFWSG